MCPNWGGEFAHSYIYEYNVAYTSTIVNGIIILDFGSTVEQIPFYYLLDQKATPITELSQTACE